ncbi:transposable element Tcb2 transposase [Trichonephila clavipes]|nr:transposable element Tcb2 transposase [Trichonephila clavipes]
MLPVRSKSPHMPIIRRILKTDLEDETEQEQIQDDANGKKLEGLPEGEEKEPEKSFDEEEQAAKPPEDEGEKKVTEEKKEKIEKKKEMEEKKEPTRWTRPKRPATIVKTKFLVNDIVKFIEEMKQKITMEDLDVQIIPSLSSCRFELPIDMTTLEALTPLNYVKKHCHPVETRKRNYIIKYEEYQKRKKSTTTVFTSELREIYERIFKHSVLLDEILHLRRLLDLDLNQDLDAELFVVVSCVMERIIVRSKGQSEMARSIFDCHSTLCTHEDCELHWCAKIKDEVETLAYQLNEEAERTERPIRRLSKVMYGSTCADMQVDVMGECLSSIKHVVGRERANNQSVRRHLDAFTRGRIIGKLEEGRSVTSVAAEFGIAHSIVSRLWRQFQTTGTAIRGFSSGRPRGTTPADDRYIVLQARRNRRQTAGEIARHTTQATGRPISRFTVARRLHGGGLFARRPVRCVPLTPAHRRRRSLWCREHRNWRDNDWGRVLFTDESRFSLSSDSHRILIWRERGSRNHPSNIIERDRGAMGLQFLFMDDNAPCHRTVAAEQLLESEDIKRMDWPARSPDLNPIEHVWDFLSRRLAARTLPPVTIRELRLALQDEWAAMPQQLIDTLILSMGRRCETCLAVRGDHIPY